jgi:hypothetical protein
VDNRLWNKVCRLRGEGREEYPVLCPVCFIELATAAGIQPTGWRLVAANTNFDEIAVLRRIVRQAAKCRNVHRGCRAEDKTVELPAGIPQNEIEQYAAELRLGLFRLLDEWENSRGAHG